MKTVFLVLLATSGPLLADTLETGSVYFDSQSTLNEVVDLSAKKDNAGILQLIQSGHVVTLPTENDIEVISTGNRPESPAEFRFLGVSTTYWTLTKFIAKSPTASIPPPTASPPPVPSPPPSVLPSPIPTSTPSDAPPQLERDENGPRVWHLVNGTWKWYHPKKSSESHRHHHKTVRNGPNPFNR